jgi:hypothetical protein
MPSIVVFLILLVGPILIAVIRHRHIVLATLDGVSSATAVTLIAFGPEIPVSYGVKAALIALGAGVWVWVQMRGAAMRATAELSDLSGP